MSSLREQRRQPWYPLQLDLREHDYPGRLVAFEGIDGSGKTSMIHLLAAYLDQRGQPHLVTKTPGDDVRNMRAWRAWHDGSWGVPRDEIDVFGLNIIALGDRIVHQRQVMEATLRRGVWVLCDRYVLTSVAFFSTQIHKELTSLLIRPDLGILIDVEPDEPRRRVRSRGSEDEHPADLDEKPLIRKRYLELAGLNHHVVVNNTSSSVDRSFARIVQYVDALLES
jgi:dTMP kinase